MELAAGLGVATFILCVLSFFFSSRSPKTKDGAQEPPVVPQTLPVIGHLLGVLRKKSKYFVELSWQCPFPIFTVQLPGQKLYVIKSMDLIQSAQKQPKVLSFTPIEAEFAIKMCGTSKAANEIIMRNLNGEEGDWGLSMEIYDELRDVLRPGSQLDAMNRIMVDQVATFMDSLQEDMSAGSTNISLDEWVGHITTSSTTDAIYGPQNPFKDTAVAKDFWLFDHDLFTILTGIAPSITARIGIAARDRIAKAFEKYFASAHFQEGSALIKTRWAVAFMNGLKLEDIARFEVGGALAALVNTRPVTFWMLLLIFMTPGLLSDIRQEIDSNIKIFDNQASLDITALKENCPLMTSTYREVLRYRTIGTSVRRVMEDTVLNGQFFQEKNAMVQIPSHVLHRDPAIWGAYMNTFDPRRFLNGKPDGNGKKKAPEAAVRAFGGGKTLCPGRHFSTNEILAITAMFVVRFDTEAVSGKWIEPTTDKTNLASVVLTPDWDPQIKVRPRKGYEKMKWSFTLKDSENLFAVAAEDLNE